jgi:hypothetical protein
VLRGNEATCGPSPPFTLTPVYYLPRDLVNIAADSITASGRHRSTT